MQYVSTSALHWTPKRDSGGVGVGVGVTKSKLSGVRIGVENFFFGVGIGVKKVDSAGHY